MFTFHALSSGLSPGFVSLCPFPNKESSILLTNPSISRLQWKQPGICVYPLHCIPAFIKGHRRLSHKPNAWRSIDNHRQSSLSLQNPWVSQTIPNFLPRGPLPSASSSSPSSKGQWTWDPQLAAGPFPWDLQHPPLAKKETTKPENKPTITTTQTPRKQVGKP